MKDFFTLELLERMNDGLSNINAREAAFKEIAENPGNKSARLLLAKLFYQDNYLEHSVRELIELRRRAPAASLDALIKSFGPLADQFNVGRKGVVGKETTHGELDFDFSIFDEE